MRRVLLALFLCASPFAARAEEPPKFALALRTGFIDPLGVRATYAFSSFLRASLDVGGARSTEYALDGTPRATSTLVLGSALLEVHPFLGDLYLAPQLAFSAASTGKAQLLAGGALGYRYALLGNERIYLLGELGAVTPVQEISLVPLGRFGIGVGF